jgi:hypothetical protein
MFDDMDKAFVDRGHLEFQQDMAYQVQTFLVRFDAIFTLNQDSLLERLYANDNICLRTSNKFLGLDFPGMKPLPDPGNHPIRNKLRQWTPKPESEFKVEERYQPCFKLHGSYNWRDGDGGQLLVMGGNKDTMIQSRQALRWYHKQFEYYLGYGFRDNHINFALREAAQKGGLQVYVVDSKGRDAIGQNNLTKTRPNNIYCPNDIESALYPILIGASKRALSETFGSDHTEHAKMMRFFA